MSAPEPVGEIQHMLDGRCVAAQVAAPDAESVLSKAAGLLADAGAVERTYADEIVKREAEYPTGLPTEPYGVALPHADKGILRSAIAVVTTREPVLFGEMGNNEHRLPVRLVIMLALPGGEKHVQAIAALAEIIQQPGALQEMIQAMNAGELFQAFIKWTRKDRLSLK